MDLTRKDFRRINWHIALQRLPRESIEKQLYCWAFADVALAYCNLPKAKRTIDIIFPAKPKR